MSLYDQSALTVAALNEFLAKAERNKKRLVCAPDVYERVRDAVRDGGYGVAYTVIERPFLEDGQVVLIASETEMDELLHGELRACTTQSATAPWNIRVKPSADEHHSA